MDFKDVNYIRKSIRDIDHKFKEHELLELLVEANNSIPDHLKSDEYLEDWEYEKTPNLRASIFWCRYDLVKFYLIDGNRSKAIEQYNKMSYEYNTFDVNDNKEILIENLIRLRNQLDTFYIELSKLGKLSKSGEPERAFTQMDSLIPNRTLTNTQNELCGWIIYRYVKTKVDIAPPIVVRRLLKKYFDLEYKKESMLHSAFLSLALKFAKTTSEFNFINFIKWWDLSNLRHEDKTDRIDGEKKYRSLWSQVLNHLGLVINKDSLVFLIDKVQPVGSSREMFYNSLYAGHYRKMYSCFEMEDYEKLLDCFTSFSKSLSPIICTSTYEKILVLLKRIDQERLPVNFFEIWSIIPYLDLDGKLWEESAVDDKVYPSLMEGLLNNWLKSNTREVISEKYLDELRKLFEYAISKLSNAKFLTRNVGLFYNKIGNASYAEHYLSLAAVPLYDQYYIWKDLSNCFNKSDMVANMLAKAILLCSTEEYLGKVRLKLCQCFCDLEEWILAKSELLRYEKFHGKASSSSINIKLNKNLTEYDENFAALDAEYYRLSQIADSVVFKNLNRVEATAYDSWYSKSGKEMVSFTNGSDLHFVEKRSKFVNVTDFKVGQSYVFYVSQMTNSNGVPKTLSFIETKKDLWASLPICYAIVDYIDQDRNVAFVVLPTGDSAKISLVGLSLSKGDYIMGSYVLKKMGIRRNVVARVKRNDGLKVRSRIDLRPIRKSRSTNKDENQYTIKNVEGPVKSNDAEVFFPEADAIIDHVNHSKGVYHYVTNSSVEGIIRFKDSKDSFEVSDTITVRYYKKKGRNEHPTRYELISFKKSQILPPNITSRSSGNIEINGKAFGFVNDTYVHPKIIQHYELVDDQSIEYLAIRNKGKWQVVKIFPATELL